VSAAIEKEDTMPYIITFESCPVQLFVEDSFIDANDPMGWPGKTILTGKLITGEEVMVVVQKIAFIQKVSDMKMGDIQRRIAEQQGRPADSPGKIIKPNFMIPPGKGH
jgi:hypothetical protein